MFRSGKSLALAYLAYFVVVAVLGGFIIASFKSSPSPKPKPPVVHQQTARPAPTRPVTPSSPTPAPKPTPSTSTGTLTDTGPGDVAGLFALASLTGAGLYRYVLVRRLTQS